jgi:hypothetical protein
VAKLDIDPSSSISHSIHPSDRHHHHHLHINQGAASMTDGNQAGDFLQEFRVVSPPSYTPIDNSTIFITARRDKTTGERIVLWREIQKAAKDVYQVRNGRVLVSFVMDDNFEE